MLEIFKHLYDVLFRSAPRNLAEHKRLASASVYRVPVFHDTTGASHKGPRLPAAGADAARLCFPAALSNGARRASPTSAYFTFQHFGLWQQSSAMAGGVTNQFSPTR